MEKERKRRHRKTLRVIIEIIFMTLGVLCAIMPAPFPLLVPIGIGAIRIISNAVRSEKKPQPVVYCNGTREPHTKEKAKTKHEIQAEGKQRRKTKAQ